MAPLLVTAAAARLAQSHDWYQSEAQGRAQFSLWAVMSSPLLISADVGQARARRGW